MYGLRPLFIFMEEKALKKLKPWQIVLLVIFYPVGIVYLIIWLCKRNKKPVENIATSKEISNYPSADTVLVNKGSKVYHCEQDCATVQSWDYVEMKEKDAIKRGLRPCKRCYGNYVK